MKNFNRIHKLLVLLVGLAVPACVAAPTTPAAPTTSPLETTQWAQVAATATALHLTAAAPTATAKPSLAPTTGATPEPSSTLSTEIGVTLINAQPVGADYLISGPVIVSVTAPGAVRVEFYTAPTGTGMAGTLEYTDADGQDGWRWSWPAPAFGFMGHVWAQAYYADGTQRSSSLLLAGTPEVFGTPVTLTAPPAALAANATLPPTTFVTLTSPPPTPTSPPAPAGLVGGLTYQTDCRQMNSRRTWWDISSPPIASPDGQSTATSFNSSNDSHIGFQVIKVDGSSSIWIPAPGTGEPVDYPAWSPDGQWIALNQIILSQPGGGDIYVVHPDGAGLAWVARYLGYHDQLAWSPDSRYLAFTDGRVIGQGSSTQVVDYQVFIAPIDSPGQRHVVASGCDPAWAP